MSSWRNKSASLALPPAAAEPSLVDANAQSRTSDTDALDFRLLTKECAVGGFTCGVSDIDKHFRDGALKAHGRFQQRATTIHRAGNPVPMGFYSLATRSEKYNLLEKDDRKAHWKDAEFPAVHLCFLAIHTKLQGNGYGRQALMHAMQTTYEIALASGLFGMTLTAIDRRTATFYHKLGFRPYGGSSDMPKLFLPIDTLVDLFEDDAA